MSPEHSSAPHRKEFSGMFLNPDRFAAALLELATPAHASEGGPSSIRLFHNTPEQTCALLSALAHGNTTCTHLDLAEVHAGAATAAVAEFLADPEATCHPHSLSLGRLASLQCAVAVGHALASPACRVAELHLHGLDDSSLSAVLTPLVSTGRLQHLELARCTLGVATVACAGAMTALQHLQLTECCAPDSVCGALLQYAFVASPTSPQLHTLGLAGVRAGPETAQALAAMLAAPGCRVHTLRLKHSSTLGDCGVAALAQGLASNTQTSSSLRELELCECGIGPAGAAALAAALPPCLYHLSLDSNQVGTQGFMALLQAISTTAPGAACFLRSLSLDGNWIRGADLPTAPQQLGWTVAAPLHRLNLARNHLSDVGAGLLAAVLRGEEPGKGPALAFLDLTGNGIGSVGAGSLVQLMQRNPGLHELRLDSNRLHDPGAALILEAVRTHPGLRVLRADQCRLTDLGLKQALATTIASLAARASREARAAAREGRVSTSSDGSDDAPLPPHKPGKRFAPEVYMVAATGTAPVGGEHAHTPQPAKPGPRMGSRFPPEVYALRRQAAMDSEECADEPKHTQGKDAGVQPAAGGALCGKHALAVEERDSDPRAGKLAGGATTPTSPALDQLHPFRDARDWEQQQRGGGSSTGCQEPASQQHSGEGGLQHAGRQSSGGLAPSAFAAQHARYRYSVDLPCSSHYMACTSATSHPTTDAGLCLSTASSYSTSPPGHRGLGGASQSVDVATHRQVVGGHAGSGPLPVLRATQSARQEGCPLTTHLTSEFTHVMTVRLKAAKKRFSKPLTPEQERLFDMF